MLLIEVCSYGRGCVLVGGFLRRSFLGGCGVDRCNGGISLSMSPIAYLTDELIRREVEPLGVCIFTNDIDGGNRFRYSIRKIWAILIALCLRDRSSLFAV